MLISVAEEPRGVPTFQDGVPEVDRELDSNPLFVLITFWIGGFSGYTTACFCNKSPHPRSRNRMSEEHFRNKQTI